MKVFDCSRSKQYELGGSSVEDVWMKPEEAHDVDERDSFEFAKSPLSITCSVGRDRSLHGRLLRDREVSTRPVSYLYGSSKAIPREQDEEV